MKAIHADPREIRKLFAEKFIIPDFQRPYSWEKEHCEKLWDDFMNFFDSKQNKEDKYFLGNIVIHPYDGAFAVIDGQQRLTTLLLLIKSLHQRAGTVHALEKCLKIEDPLTSQLTDELRVQSHVFENDKLFLYDIIFKDGSKAPDDCKLKRNFIHFNTKLSEWLSSVSHNTAKLNDLILTLLDNVVMLPIHCGSEDDALTIFETINNRGMALTDADIFKAKLHHAAGSKDKDVFIEKWNAIENHEWLFRIYMYILRAKENDTSREIALRSFFSVKSRLQNNWQSVMESLHILHEINKNWQSSDIDEIGKKILLTYPNQYWHFPLNVFLHKYGKYTTEEGFYLPEDKKSLYSRLVKETVKYFFIKGIVYNSVNAVRDTVYKVCALIEKNEDFISEYLNNSKSDVDEFKRRVGTSQYGRYQRGLVLIASLYNPKQSESDYNQILNSCHIEHILPKKWNNYDEWTNDTWQKALNTLGNLVPLEWNLNISAKNEFFARKKELYKNSKVQDAIYLTKFDTWHPKEYENRHKETTDRLLSYFL